MSTRTDLEPRHRLRTERMTKLEPVADEVGFGPGMMPGPAKSETLAFVLATAVFMAIVVAAGMFVIDGVGRADTKTPPVDQLLASAPQRAATHPATTAPPANPSPIAMEPKVNVLVTGTLSWALLDRTTGARFQSTNASKTSYTESMIKTWIAADYLRLTQQSKRQPSSSKLALISTMIRDSSDSAAQTLWRSSGGDSSIARMISMCKLTDTKVYRNSWSRTMMSARDAVRLGECVVNGTAAGPTWTNWLLTQMRQIRGAGDFGIADALPSGQASQVSYKNGWTAHSTDGLWRVNCLALHPKWILAVMVQYPARLGLKYGESMCTQVAQQALGVPAT
jgi:hypothetical protein